MVEKKTKLLPERLVTIKVDTITWRTLKSLKGEGESFNDVIKNLLNQRSKSMQSDSAKLIAYKRKRGFINLAFGDSFTFEFEYNDIKDNRSDFVLDIKIIKVFFRNKSYNPSSFFGVDNNHKHYSDLFIYVYFEAIEKILLKEFGLRENIMLIIQNYGIGALKKLFYEYGLSEESFKEDIERVLQLKEDDKPSKVWLKKIKESPEYKSKLKWGRTV